MDIAESGRFRIPIYSNKFDIDTFSEYNYIPFDESFLYFRVINKKTLEQDVNYLEKYQNNSDNLYHISDLHLRELNSLFKKSKTFATFLKPYFIDYEHEEYNDFKQDVDIYFG